MFYERKRRERYSRASVERGLDATHALRGVYKQGWMPHTQTELNLTTAHFDVNRCYARFRLPFGTEFNSEIVRVHCIYTRRQSYFSLHEDN